MSELRTNRIVPRDGLASGMSGGIIQIVHKDYRDFFSTTALIPLDDTIPQNTEGAEVFTQAITPTRSDSKILMTCVLNISNSDASNLHTAAIFRDSVADSIAAGWALAAGANAPSLSLIHI